MSDESYDVYTVAFGIRNMTHIDTVSADNFHFSVCLHSFESLLHDTLMSRVIVWLDCYAF